MILYHGTKSSNVETCEDLVSGHDGMIHFALTKDSAYDFSDSKRRGHNYSLTNVVSCDADLDANNLPVIPDLGYWGPFKMAQELKYQDIINDRELQRIYDHNDIGGRAERFVPAEYREEYVGTSMDDIPVDSRMSLRELLEYDLREGYDDAKDILDLLDRNERARDDLFNILKSKGVHAFKYHNTGDLSQAGQWSIAVINSSILDKPKLVSVGKYGHPEMDSVTTAVDEYKRSRVVAQHSAAPDRMMEYRGLSREPSYRQRIGRGRVGY